MIDPILGFFHAIKEPVNVPRGKGINATNSANVIAVDPSIGSEVKLNTKNKVENIVQHLQNNLSIEYTVIFFIFG
jgi:sensor histidine kinase regulating citrate/malate metabolism